MNKSAALVALLWAGAASAQTAVQQTGPITNNSPVMWSADHHIRQAAGAAGDVAGKMITGGLSAVGNLCAFTSTTDQSPHSLCLNPNGSLSYDGTTYPISGGGGNVVGPASSTVDHVATWAAGSGMLLKSVDTLGLAGLTVTGAPANWVMTPTNQIASSVTYTTTASGTVASTPTDTNQMAITWLKQTGALQGPGVNRSMGTFEADYNDTGTTNNNDNFTGVTGNCNLLNPRTPNGKQTACVGVVGAARSFASHGGTLGAEQGELHAMNIVAGPSNVLGTIPTNFYDVIGAEANLTGCTGCTMKVRIGFNSGDFGNGGSGDSEQGSTIDAAYAIFSVAGTKGWRYGIDFAGGPVYHGNAIAPSGTLLGSTAATPVIAGHGIDLQNFTISGMAFRSPGGGFVVTGAGDMQAVSVTAATSGLITNAPNGSSAVVDFRDTNVQTWQVGREATTDDFFIKNMDSVGPGAGIRMRFVNATGAVVLPALPASAGGGGLAVCVDTAGTLYKKAACP